MTNRDTYLYRPDEGRWLAGVAAGLSLRFGVPVLLIRIAFVVLCFAGGLGALLYVAGWLLIPGEGETDSIAQGWVGTGQARRWVGVILVALAILILASGTDLIRADLAFAVILIGIGVMLYRGDLGRGVHRSRTGRPAEREESPQETPEAAAAPPAPETAAAPAPPKERSYLGRVCMGVAVIALGVMGLLDGVVAGFHPDFHHYAALAVGVIGLGVAVGAWFGRPAGLVVLGILLLPILILSRLVAVGGLDLLSIEFASAGHVNHRPGSVEQIRQGYELEVGSMTVDLRDVDFAGQTVTMEAQVGIGELRVLLPDDVAADVNGQVGVGTLEVGDWDRNGVGVEADLQLEGASGTVVLDLDVGMGEIEVRPSPADTGTSYRAPDDDETYFLEEHRIQDSANLEDSYTLTAGTLRLDLGDLTLEEDRLVLVNVDRGEVRVTVPEDLSLRTTTRVNLGRLTLFDEVREGLNLNATYSTRVPGTPLLTLDIWLGEGTLTVEEN